MNDTLKVNDTTRRNTDGRNMGTSMAVPWCHRVRQGRPSAVGDSKLLPLRGDALLYAACGDVLPLPLLCCCRDLQDVDMPCAHCVVVLGVGNASRSVRHHLWTERPDCPAGRAHCHAVRTTLCLSPSQTHGRARRSTTKTLTTALFRCSARPSRLRNGRAS